MKDRKLKIGKKEKAAIEELKREVLRKFPSAKFTLFGSVTKGCATDESDVDVLVLLDKIDKNAKERIRRISYEIELKKDVALGLIVESRADWEKCESLEMPLCQEVWKYGIPL